MGDDDFMQQFVSSDSPYLTDEETRQLFTAAPRQTGKASVTNTSGPSSTTPSQAVEVFRLNHLDRREINRSQLARLLEELANSGIMLWTSNRRFTYAAVYAAGFWFITGEGIWYGKSKFTPYEFAFEVLGHPEVTSLAVGLRFQTLWEV